MRAWMLILAVLCFGSWGFGTDLTVYLEWFPNQTHAPFFVADAHGFYEQAGLRVRFLPGGADPTLGAKAVLTGHAQFTLIETPTFIRIVTEGATDLVAVGVWFQALPYVWFARPDSDIQGFSDFRGHRVARLGPFAPELFLVRILELNGVGEDEITWVHAGVGVAPVVSGRADIGQGYLNWEPIEMAKRYGEVKTWRVGDFVDIPGLVVVSSRPWLEAHPEVAKAFLRATEQGFAETFRDPDRAAEIVHAVAPDLEIELIRAGIHVGIDTLWREENGSYLGMTVRAWDEALRWTYFARLIDDVVPVRDLFIDEFLG